MIKSKKILIFVVSVFMFFGLLNVSAITTGSTTGTTDTGSKIVTDQASLTVSGVENDDHFNAYKVLDTYYNATTNTISYQFTNDFQKFLSSSDTYRDLTVDNLYKYTSGNISSGSTLSTSDIDKLASAYAGYVRKNSVNGTAMNVSANTASAQLQAGSYLVLPTQTLKVYAVMFGNLDFTANGDSWTINNETITAKVSNAGVSKSVGEENMDNGSYSIGDDIPFIVKATVPQYPTNATNKTYVIKDTVTAGLTFNGVQSVIIHDGDETLVTASNGNVTNSSDEQVATININGQTLTITFDVDYVNSTALTINYSAKLNNNAGLGATGGNKNSVSLTYSNDPYGTGSYTTIPADGDGEVDIYVYGLEIYKYGESDDSGNVALQNAEFTIYKDSSLNNKIATVTTNDRGIAQYKGLGAGTYYVKETKAPTGYVLDSTIHEIKIGPSGTLEPADTEGYYRLEVSNQKAGLLPVTGSVGTILFVVLGLAIIGIAVYFFGFYKKNKKQEEQAI